MSGRDQRSTLSTQRLLRNQSVGAVRLVGRYVVWRRDDGVYVIWPGGNIYAGNPFGRRYDLSQAIMALTR